MTLPELSEGARRWFARVPSKTLSRSILGGLLSVPIFAPLLVVPLAVAGAEGLAFWPFLLIKSTFSAFQAAIVTPLVAVTALLPDSEARLH